MISVAEAIEIVRQQTLRLPTERVGLDEVLGRVLAEEVIADSDLPPFNRSQMDGYAVRAEDVKAVPVRLRIVPLMQAWPTRRPSTAGPQGSGQRWRVVAPSLSVDEITTTNQLTVPASALRSASEPIVFRVDDAKTAEASEITSVFLSQGTNE